MNEHFKFNEANNNIEFFFKFVNKMGNQSDIP